MSGMLSQRGQVGAAAMPASKSRWCVQVAPKATAARDPCSNTLSAFDLMTLRRISAEGVAAKAGMGRLAWGWRRHGLVIVPTVALGAANLGKVLLGDLLPCLPTSFRNLLWGCLSKHNHGTI